MGGSYEPSIDDENIIKTAYRELCEESRNSLCHLNIIPKSFDAFYKHISDQGSAIVLIDLHYKCVIFFVKYEDINDDKLEDIMMMFNSSNEGTPNELRGLVNLSQKDMISIVYNNFYFDKEDNINMMYHLTRNMIYNATYQNNELKKLIST
jgi:hypothetical protein